jgi:hypothetical protein
MKQLYGKLKDIKRLREKIVEKIQEIESQEVEKIVKKKNVQSFTRRNKETGTFCIIFIKKFHQICVE